MRFNYPETKEQYWNMVDENWEDIYHILLILLPKNELRDADNFRTLKNPQIVKLFSMAWHNAPNPFRTHNIPGWDILCNLCVESYLLFE